MGFNVTKLRQMVREEVKSVKDSRLSESKLRCMISEEVKSVVRSSKRAGRLAEDADPSKIDPTKFPTKLSAAATTPGIEAAVTGGFEQFKDPAAMKASVEAFTKSGSDKVSADEATKIAEEKGGVDGLVKMFMKNLSGATMSVPEWAPSRPDMPIIDEKDVPGALAALNNGEIDLNPPYHEGDAAGSKQNSGYTRSGTVVAERWQRLAGLIK